MWDATINAMQVKRMLGGPFGSNNVLVHTEVLLMIKGVKFISLFLILFTFASCNNDSDTVVDFDQFYSALPKYNFNGHISLYGEAHAVQAILDKERSLWSEAYTSGARHLFIEMPFYTAE
ncbi:MAG TPA: hypothetical protein PKK43_06460, partial [Spirochaetota bacterium]|nr:hypothetical protein [Spirochaetota bacterium]